MTGEMARGLGLILLLSSWIAGLIGFAEMRLRRKDKQDKKPPLQWD